MSDFGPATAQGFEAILQKLEETSRINSAALAGFDARLASLEATMAELQSSQGSNRPRNTGSAPGPALGPAPGPAPRAALASTAPTPHPTRSFAAVQPVAAPRWRLNMATLESEALTRLVGHSSWRKEQLPVVQAMATHKHILAVLKTGGGKTALFTVPALMEQLCAQEQERLPRMTVVVVPSVALRMDMSANARQAGLQVHEATGSDHTPNTVDDSTALLVVVSDTAVSKPFITMLHMEEARRQHEGNSGLLRLVFDEAHAVLVDGTWRPKLRKARDLLQLNTAFLLLTASLPPAWESPLITAYDLPSATVVRASTHRPELQLSILDAADERRHVIDQVRTAWPRNPLYKLHNAHNNGCSDWSGALLPQHIKGQAWSSQGAGLCCICE